ncbi:hypothetical protein BSNK01_12520 [Bacillaceae bacterium]
MDEVAEEGEGEGISERMSDMRAMLMQALREAETLDELYLILRYVRRMNDEESKADHS